MLRNNIGLGVKRRNNVMDWSVNSFRIFVLSLKLRHTSTL